jgi:hypothetical protein
MALRVARLVVFMMWLSIAVVGPEDAEREHQCVRDMTTGGGPMERRGAKIINSSPPLLGSHHPAS